MYKNINDYINIVGSRTISTLLKNARKLYEKRILNINSTFLGGGVCEILTSMMPLMNNLGLETEWRVIHGTLPYYNITKKMHNGLQSGDVDFSPEEKSLYLSTNFDYSLYTNFDHDIVVIHDPQPLPLASMVNQYQPWIFRCHIDLSNPNKKLWEFLEPFILRYSKVIVSREEYKRPGLPVDQVVIQPAIDPLTPKNRYMSKDEAADILKDMIPLDKPFISQISRMDVWKDPEGLLEIFRKVKEKVDCRLLYCFNAATDDPEGAMILNKIKEKAKDLIDTGDVLFVIGDNPLVVNAIQTYSGVVVQKSTREGFGLVVTEALWKGTPVVASNVGGIPSQIIDNETGYLVDPYNFDGFADRIIELLKNKKKGEEFGIAAREHVRENFLVTRLMNDYMELFLELL